MAGDPDVRWPYPLVEATLLRRYKRFLADVRLPDGTEVLAHCPNSGRMTACWAPGVPCRVSHRPDPKRKLKWTLEQTCMDGDWVLINTALPNAVVAEGIRDQVVDELVGYDLIESEKRYGESRLDLRLTGPRGVCWVEVKNVTLLEADGVLRFPDAVSARGTRHAGELADIVAGGARAVLFFHVGRGGGSHVEPAEAVDPAYAAALREAVARGVEVVAMRADMDAQEIRLGRGVEVRL